MKTNTFRIGDKVSVIDDNFNGTIIAINGNSIKIDTEDGFELEFLSKELIKIDEDENMHSKHKPLFKTEDKVVKKAKSFKNSSKDKVILEIDLHIEKLVINPKQMNAYDMLEKQLETAKRQLEFAIKNKIQRMVFIHGMGEGVLKTELEFLFKRYSVSYQDASYTKYGLGATEVFIKQNAKLL